MHPNAFLRTYWRSEFRPVVFVAMSFDERFTRRFTEIIQPAVAQIAIDGIQLSAVRVDITNSGDSILTQILDHIAHSVFILADISVIGRDSATSKSYRNANVLYEVGLAVAARQASEILLMKDDREPSLFDVSVIPQLHIDFADVEEAKAKLTEQISARLRDVQYYHDARLALAIQTMSTHEMGFMLRLSQTTQGHKPIILNKAEVLSSAMISRILDKGLLRVSAVLHSEQQSVYEWTPLGLAAIESINNLPRASVNVTDSASDSPDNPVVN